jgi:uncharacterized membrane protein YfcA
MTFLIGIVAPISGIGGGILFVPLALAFFPFNIDFIRGAGLVMALTSALSSTPRLSANGLSRLTMVTPILAVSIPASIAGSVSGLWLTDTLPDGEHYIAIALGVLLLVIFFIMTRAKHMEFPEVEKADRLSEKLGIPGVYYEPSLEKTITFKTTNLPLVIAMFGLLGFFAGLFGIGAGVANVPVLNLVMGAPIKVATATSMMMISVNNAAATWVYLAKGSILPAIFLPCVIGATVGARIGARLALRANAVLVHYLVMLILLLASILDIAKGLSGLGVIP